ncbi:MAG: T9SS type A sorting domain-containing protein [bacterium]
MTRTRIFRVFFLAYFYISIGVLLSQSRQITPEFFGVDFWGRDPQRWRQFFEIVDEDTVAFGLASFGSVGWENVEPEPPVHGKHAYDWTRLDEFVRVVFESGRALDVELLPRNNWATLVPVSEMDEACCDMSPLKEDADSDTAQWGMTASQAWGDFVHHLVERYDGDGVDDAPGITQSAIKYLQLGNEPEAPSHFIEYGGTPERYDRMLEVMYNAARDANPNITVVRGKSNPAHIFDDDPDETTLRARRGDYLDFLATSLRLSKTHYDIFAINFNDHYTGLFPLVHWLQGEMAKNGTSKPFLVGDARTTAYPRDNDDAGHILPPRYPPGFADTLRDPGHPQHVANRRLYHADEVRQSLKKILTALASGQEAVSLQPVLGPVEHTRALWQDAGLIDARVWQATGDLRQARKPVYYASKQLIDALLGADRQVEIFDLGPDVLAYKVNNQGKPLLFLWHENPFDVDAQGLLRRNQQVTVDLTSVMAASQLRVTHFVTELDSNRDPVFPQDALVSANEVTIDETPALVDVPVTTAVDAGGASNPGRLILQQNYPNPFNPNTTILFFLPRRAHVTLSVFDILGRESMLLVDEELSAGQHSVVFDAKYLSSGVYFYRIRTDREVQSRKLLLLR